MATETCDWHDVALVLCCEKPDHGILECPRCGRWVPVGSDGRLNAPQHRTWWQQIHGRAEDFPEDGLTAPAQPPGRDAAAGETDERVEEWLRLCGVIRDDGSFDQAQALMELHDYFFVLGEAGKVYDHITGGRISKQNTYAFEVIAAADDLAIEETNEAVREALAAGSAALRGQADALAARTRLVHAALRSAVIGTFTNGYGVERWLCETCGARWDDPATEAHTGDCLAALPAPDGGRAS